MRVWIATRRHMVMTKVTQQNKQSSSRCETSVSRQTMMSRFLFQHPPSALQVHCFSRFKCTLTLLSCTLFFCSNFFLLSVTNHKLFCLSLIQKKFAKFFKTPFLIWNENVHRICVNDLCGFLTFVKPIQANARWSVKLGLDVLHSTFNLKA